MSYYLGPLLVTMMALMEASVLPLFRVYDLQPNLTLVLLIAWLIVRGANEAFVLAPIGALMLGLVGGAPLGTALLALAPLALLQELRGSQLREGGFVAAVGFTVVMSLFFNYVHLAVFSLQGQGGDWLIASTQIILPTVFLNVLLLLPVYAILALFSSEQRRTVYA